MLWAGPCQQPLIGPSPGIDLLCDYCVQFIISWRFWHETINALTVMIDACVGTRSRKLFPQIQRMYWVLGSSCRLRFDCVSAVWPQDFPVGNSCFWSAKDSLDVRQSSFRWLRRAQNERSKGDLLPIPSKKKVKQKCSSFSRDQCEWPFCWKVVCHLMLFSLGKYKQCLCSAHSYQT